MITIVVLAFLLAFALLVSAFLIAQQEVCIEGPFGWGALTFTRRYGPKTNVGRIFQMVTGKDKTVTLYHLVSIGIWLMLFLIPVPFVLMFQTLSGTENSQLTWMIVAMSISCWIVEMNLEDWLWFEIHPWYGPDRHNKRFVPWFQNFKGGVPITYITSTTLALLLIAGASWWAGQPKALVIWGIAVLLVLATCLVIKTRVKHQKRNPLSEYWWETPDLYGVLIKRQTYPEVEYGTLIESAIAYGISRETLEELIANGKIRPIEKVLSPKQKTK